MKRKILNLLIIPLVICGLVIVADGAKAAPASTLYFSSATNTVTNGSNFTLDAMINPDTNRVSAVALRINYDPTKIVLDSITPSSTFSLVLANAVINNTNGTASIDLAVPTNVASITAISKVATLNFRAIANANNSIVLFGSSQAAAEEEASDVITTRNGATVTINQAVDVTAPVISNGRPSGTLPVGTTQTEVSINTNEFSTCKYSTQSGLEFDFISEDNYLTSTNGTTHSFVKNGLVDGGSYGFYIRCIDFDYNANSNDYLISFSVAAPAPVVNPINPAPAPVVKKSSSSKDDDKKETKPRSISNSKKTVARGAVLAQRGKKFSKNSIVLLYFSKTGGGYYPPTKVKTSNKGAFLVNYRVNKPVGTYSWYAIDSKTGKKSKTVYYKVK